MGFEDKDILQKTEEWLKWDKDEKSRLEISRFKEQGELTKLAELLMKRLEFGTAGLRGRMGPGYSQMNELVILQTSQGLATYIAETVKSWSGDMPAPNGVVIGYDGRHNSKRFAELSAVSFLSLNIPVHLFSEVCPTPFVPFSVNLLGCAAGIMVTASHNPKEDNGYKVYWNNGAQIIPPHDKNIQVRILANLCPWPDSWNTAVLEGHCNLSDPLKRVMTSYYTLLQEAIFKSSMNASSPIKITYTAMHGVGHRYMVEAFKAANLKPFFSVLDQEDPDPDFSTVTFPNPEEGKSALDLALTMAKHNESSLILANDPDADRLAAAEVDQKGEWHVFSGNELGALLGWWIYQCHINKHPDADVSQIYMLASTVSSKLLRSMACKEGFNFIETLTGFKWMGNRAYELMAKGKTVLFAFEEAIGFMCGTAVLDKDGVSAAIKVAELAAFLAERGQTLVQKLDQLYTEYGYHLSQNSYFICHEQTVIKKIFERLRNFQGASGTYPASLADGKYPVKAVRDLTSGHDSSQPDLKAVLPVSKSSQMVTFTFDNGMVATLRTSGTEPKIKYYAELCATPDQQDKDALREMLNNMVRLLVQEFLQAEENALLPKKD